MAFLEWQEDYSVNVAEIDDQHQELFKLMNDLYEAIVSGRSKEVLDTVLETMTNYANYHFEYEESVFDECGFSESASHKEEHQAYVQKVSEFKQGSEQNRPMLPIDVINYLKDWWLDYICVTDKKYTACFNENGIR
jgi:hemerythrin